MKNLIIAHRNSLLGLPLDQDTHSQTESTSIAANEYEKAAVLVGHSKKRKFAATSMVKSLSKHLQLPEVGHSKKRKFAATSMVEALSKHLQLPEEEKKCFKRDVFDFLLSLRSCVDLTHSSIFPSIQKIYYTVMTVDLAKHYHKDTSCIIRIKKHLADLGLQQTSNSFVYTIKANICHIREQTQLPDEAKRNLIQQLTSFGLGVLDCTESMQAEQEELLEYYKQIKPELDRAYKLISQEVRDSKGAYVAGSFPGPISTPYSPR